MNTSHGKIKDFTTRRLEIRCCFRAAATDESDMSKSSLFLSTATIIIFIRSIHSELLHLNSNILIKQWLTSFTAPICFKSKHPRLPDGMKPHIIGSPPAGVVLISVSNCLPQVNQCSIFI